MDPHAIRADGLSKRYRLGALKRGHETLRDALADAFRAAPRAREEDHIWALRDVTFDVPHGEVMGVIGRNGAGKSTLLKVLSRITEPTAGCALIDGRVGSLLEVGTGFHPDLSGRENIWLNGAVLGMRRAETRRRFDEIVQFAEVERFLDTPVKRYSSGMYLRLAFAVAAHLEPDILLVDEVLAVGDVAFQKKCLTKMSEVARGGRTILFVSHNMAAVSNLCRSAFRLDGGRIVDRGDAGAVVRRYLAREGGQPARDLTEHPGRTGGSRPVLRHVRLTSRGNPTATFASRDPLEMEVTCAADGTDMDALSLGLLIKDVAGTHILGGNMNQYDAVHRTRTGRVIVRATIDRLDLAPGAYTISLFVGNGTFDLDEVEEAIAFDVVWERQADIPSPPRPEWGSLLAPLRWESTDT
ncbi:MAG TPA: ABC transporter ATP-binding protein [Gemmatimonadaceae bacterium]|nr:ABC transporter ATP-binding protein [Gemmatimonadaceae bacterium]